MKKLNVDEKMMDDLYETLLSIKSKKDLKLFLDDLCTDNELDQMACRIKAARLLLDNETYNEIIEKTNISSATLSRVSRCVKYGKGYNLALKDKK